jgi:4-amino-4-deoxy-L-arabinose transferase-like glycosyltransferase
MPTPKKAPDRLILWAIVFIAALVRLAYALTPRIVRWDEAGHLTVASNLVAGRGYSELAGTLDIHLPPFLPIVSAGLMKLGISPVWATAIIHIVTSALLCLPVYALGRSIYGRRTGFIAAVLVAVYPALAAWPLYWSTMTESPFLLFVFSGVWAAGKAWRMANGEWRMADGGWQMADGGWQMADGKWQMADGRWQMANGKASHQLSAIGHRPSAIGHRPSAIGWYAATGFFFGLAYLARPEGLTYFAVIGLFIALSHLLTGAFWRPTTIAKLALAVVVCLLVMAPYVLYLHSVTGRWLLSGKMGIMVDIAPAYVANDQAGHDRAVSALDATGTEIMWLSADRFNKSLGQYIFGNPARFFWQVRQNMALTWKALFHEDLFSPWIVALAALGLFARPWPRARWRAEVLLWAALLPLASFWAFFVLSRFLVSALPVGMLWAAAGLDHLDGWVSKCQPLSERPIVRLAAAFPLVATVAFCLWLVPGTLQRETTAMPWSHADAGRWLAANSAPAAVVMTRHTEVGLYAGRPVIACPNATWPQILAYGRARNARYLVVDSVEVTSLRPQLAPLLEMSRVSPLPGVRFAAAFDDLTRRTLVYEIEAGP